MKNKSGSTTYGIELMASEDTYDIIIVGAGVLGTSLAYFLSLSYNGKIAIIDKESMAGEHTSTRNTGVIHRPFYLDPDKKKVFASSAQDSYPLWKELSSKFDLPWSQVGTLEIAVREKDVQTIEKYAKWSSANGMQENEIQIFDKGELASYAPEVNGFGAILSKTDTGVSFGVYSKKLIELAQENGIRFLSNFRITAVSEDSGSITVNGYHENKVKTVRGNFMFNTAGGGSLKIAQKLGLARKYASLHFRGDYWTVKENFGKSIKHNIYTVPRHTKFPFLDPHFVLRHNGIRELGPTATLVASAYDYVDKPDPHSMVMKLLEKPAIPKIKLVTNREFLNLVRTEWKSSRSKSAMAERVREFIPDLNDSYLDGRGLSGVRSSLIDSDGFVPEAVLAKGERSYHILNYNSPGATGSPVYAVNVLKSAEQDGFLKLLQPKDKSVIWSDYLVRQI